MSEENIVLEKKLEGIADYVRRYLNQYKAQLLMKGYRLIREWNIQPKKGMISRRGIGGMVKIEKKFKDKHLIKHLIKIMCCIDEDDVVFRAWSAKPKKQIPPELIAELENLTEITLEKLKK